MNIYHSEIDLYFQKNHFKFNYSFNDNTKFGDLLEYVSFLYPNFNLCRCFCFFNNYSQFNNEMKLKDCNLNGFLSIGNFNNDNKCYCLPKVKELLKMSKNELINKILNNNNNNDYYSIGQTLGGMNSQNINQQLLEKSNQIKALNIKIEEYKKQIADLVNQIKKLKANINGINTIRINENNNIINEKNLVNFRYF